MRAHDHHAFFLCDSDSGDAVTGRNRHDTHVSRETARCVGGNNRTDRRGQFVPEPALTAGSQDPWAAGSAHEPGGRWTGF